MAFIGVMTRYHCARLVDRLKLLDLRLTNFLPQKSNAAFVTELVDAGKARGVSLGIYGGWFDYPLIVGKDYSYTSNLPLWYQASHIISDCLSTSCHHTPQVCSLRQATHLFGL